jgi:predicted ester cyclase
MIRATHTGAFGRWPQTGRQIEVPVLDLFHIRDRLLIEHWALLDNVGVMKQFGALPA